MSENFLENRTQEKLTFKFPKNVRQVGQIDENQKIYIEDYVVTYIKQLAMKNYEKYQVAVLVGKYICSEHHKNIFINGAIEIKETLDENLIFSKEAWSEIYENIKKYFNDVEITGWFISKAGIGFDITEDIEIIWKENFQGEDKVLVMFDSLENEEAIYLYADDFAKKQKGYYVYYERNEEMQNYMIDNKNGYKEEQVVPERAIKEVRQVINNKKIKHKKSNIKLTYIATMLMAIILLVSSITMFNNYEQIKDIENTISSLNENNNLSQNQQSIVKQTENNNLQTENSNIENENIDKNNDSENNIDDNSKNDETDINNEELDSDLNINDEQLDSDNMKNENNLSENNSIEASAQSNIKTYVIQKGDTLVSICLQNYDSLSKINEIKQINRIDDENLIFEGQIIILPD